MQDRDFLIRTFNRILAAISHAEKLNEKIRNGRKRDYIDMELALARERILMARDEAKRYASELIGGQN